MASSLRGLERLLKRGDRACTWHVHPESWFDLPLAAQRCADSGASLELHLRDGRTVPMATLPIADLTAAYETIREWWRVLSGENRPQSLAPEAFETLVAELRSELRGYADRLLAGGANGDAQLAFPPLDHPLLADERAAMRFWSPFLPVQDSAAVRAAAIRHAEREDATTVAAQLPWLRILLQRQLALQWHPRLQEVLVAVYAEADARSARIAAEQAACAEVGLEWLAQSLLQELDLLQPAPRGRAFRRPKRGTGSAAQLAAAQVTVLIPSYKHEAYVAKAIRSALDQTIGSVRVLVVDDQSPDGTVAAAEAIHDPRLEVRRNPANLGLGNSVLAALETISTPYVALLNSDDLFHPQRLEKCLDVLRSDADCDLVGTDLWLVDREDRVLAPQTTSALFHGRNVRDWVRWYERTKPVGNDRDAMFGELLERNFLATSSNIVCRTDWLRGHADALRSLKYCLDWQLFLDAAREHRLHWIPERLIAYRLHPSNTVWFDRGKRWAYSLEVDRVAAHAIRQRIASLAADDPQRVELGLRLVSKHLRRNTEVDWAGLFLNELIGGYALERGTEESQSVAEIAAEIEQHVRDADLERERREALRVQALTCKLRVATDEGYSGQGRERWQRERIAALSEELAGWRATAASARADAERESAGVAALRSSLDQARAAMAAQIAERDGAIASAEARLSAVAVEQQRLQVELEAECARHAAARSGLARLLDELQGLREELRVESERHAAAVAEHHRVQQDLAGMRERLAATDAALLRTRTELERSKRDAAASLADREAELKRVWSALDAERRGAAAAAQRLAETAGEVGGVRAYLARTRQEHLARCDAYEHRLATRGKAQSLLGSEIARLLAVARARESRTLVVRGTHVVPGASTHGLLRRLAKWRRKLGSSMRSAATPGAAVVVATDDPDVLQEFAAFGAAAGAATRAIVTLDGTALPARLPEVALPGAAAIWAFPEWAARDWAVLAKRGAGAAELARRLCAHLGCGDDALPRELAADLAWARSAARMQARVFVGGPDSGGLFRAALAARLLGLPWVAILEGPRAQADRREQWALQELASAALVVARSPSVAAWLAGRGLQPERVISRPGPLIDAEAGTEGPLRMMVSTPLRAGRGLEEMVEAIAGLPESAAGCELHVQAAVPRDSHEANAMAARLRAIAAAADCRARFDFPEVVDAAARGRFYAAGPGVLLAPWYGGSDDDGLDRGVLEAMGAGLAIVGSDAPAVSRAVTDGREACLVRAGDWPAFAAAVARLVADPARRRELAQRARERYRAEFAPARTQSALVDAWKRLLAR